MKCRKLRKKHKKLFTKSFPVLSVFHNIASNYKQWNIRYIQSLECFSSSYFTKIKKSTVAVYNESEKNILLSGDVESNPDPVTRSSEMLALCLKQQQMTGRISCSTIDFLGMV